VWIKAAIIAALLLYWVIPGILFPKWPKMNNGSKTQLFLGLSFFAFAGAIAWLTYTIQPLIEPVRETIVAVKSACTTFDDTAKPAVQSINELTTTVKKLSIRDLFKGTDADELTGEILFGDRPQYSRQEIEAWVGEYVEQQELLMRGGKQKPTRAEVRRELVTRFPGLTFLMVLYYVVLIMSMLG